MSEPNCEICSKNTRKYSCPRCNILYCSVECYRSEQHIGCSESFYKKCVEEELRNCQSDSETKRKMLKILQEMHEAYSTESLDSDDSEDEPDICNRMSNVNLDNEEDVWNALTTEEKHEFRKLVASGDIIKLLPNWEPWWKIIKKKALVYEIGTEEVNLTSACPLIPSQIKELSVLTKTKPSPMIPFMLINILASYVFTLRWFKGSCMEMCVELISTCIALSNALRTNKVFNNAKEAYLSFEDDFLKCEWLKNAELNRTQINEDLKDIVNGQYKDDKYFCIKAVLSDLKTNVSEAVKVIKKSKTQHIKRFSGESPNIDHLCAISKKITFYLSWTVSYGESLVKVMNSYC